MHTRLALGIAALVLAGCESTASPQNEGPSRPGLVYAAPGGHELRVDILYPSAPPPKAGYPLIISIHGGGWVQGNRSQDLLLRPLVEHGYALASIDYRLSTRAKFPAQIDDARSALDWLIANARSLKLDAGNIGVTGASAGGQLALLLGLDPARKPNPIKAICAFYPPTDLVAIIPAEKHDRPDNLVAQLLGGPIGKHLALARAGSPLTHAGASSPPVLLIHGDKDRLVPIEQSRLLDRALRAAGAKSHIIVYEGKAHGFELRSETVEAIATFFDAQLKP